MPRGSSNSITIGCTATDCPPLGGSKPAREPGVSFLSKIGEKLSGNTGGVLSYWNMKEFSPDSKPNSISEYPLYSDAHITGELNDEKGPYKFLNMISGVHGPGLIYDAITLRMFWYIDD